MGYLDYNATTPLSGAALRAMMPYLTDHHGNPSSIHQSGRRARAAIDDARERFAGLLGVRPHEIIFTSGGTEADNLAVMGLARAHRKQGKRVVTISTEHHAVLVPFQQLADSEGFDLTILPVDYNGELDLEMVDQSLRDDTILLSVMSANNETGVRQRVGDLAAMAAARGVMFHSDMVQSFGKEPVEVGGMTAASFASHKVYGPKGAGAVYLAAGVPLVNLHWGGSHENQRRPGTENVAAIVGFVAAAEEAVRQVDSERSRLGELRERLWEGVREVAPFAQRNGRAENCLENTLNVSFPGMDGETLLIGLDLEGVAVSSGSACMVGSVVASHVLLAMGVPKEVAQATVRFSMGRMTGQDDIEGAITALKRVLARQEAVEVVR